MMPIDPAADRIAKWRRASLLAGAAATTVLVAGFLFEREQALRSFLFAYLYWLGMGLGCLGILLLHHTVGGKWGMVVRRFAEAGARTLPFMSVLFVPVLLSIPILYPWARQGALNDAVIRAKAAYLNVPFFLGRALIYFLVWTFYAVRLSQFSARQDAGASGVIEKMKALSAPGLVVFTFVTTFAFIDWVMSLEPDWFSTIYGIMFLVGQVLGAFALLIALVIVLSRCLPIREVLTTQHLHDLGNLMFAFMVLWAYLSFSQFLIIWAGNLPDETPWYLRRLHGGWGWVALTLVVFHFATPFVLLLMRKTKRHADRLLRVCALILFIRIVDVYWVVEPGFYRKHIAIHWLDFVTPLAVGGLWLAVFFWQVSARPLLPFGDPRLAGSPRETVAF